MAEILSLSASVFLLIIMHALNLCGEVKSTSPRIPGIDINGDIYSAKVSRPLSNLRPTSTRVRASWRCTSWCAARHALAGLILRHGERRAARRGEGCGERRRRLHQCEASGAASRTVSSVEDCAGARHAAAVLEESLSLETVGNAFFTRVVHTDVRSLRKLAIVNNRFQLPRAVRCRAALRIRQQPPPRGREVLRRHARSQVRT